jgi:hypothetical protein
MRSFLFIERKRKKGFEIVGLREGKMGLFKKGKKFRENHKPSYGIGDEPKETYKPSYSTAKDLRKRKK